MDDSVTWRLSDMANGMERSRILSIAASVRARHVDGQDGLVHHSLLCRPACHLQRRKVFVWILESHLSS